MTRRFNICKHHKSLMGTLLCCALLGLGSHGTLAQQTSTTTQIQHIELRGTVVDEYERPLGGATITVVGTSTRTVADSEGKFQLSVLPGTTIRVSFLTMIPKDRVINSSDPIKVRLESYDISIGEVVVTGYGQTTTRRTTGSVAVVDGELLKDQPLFNVDKLLQGKVAGVNIKSVSGRPGESAQVRIRGTNTITGNAEPLWVVDGVPLQKDIPQISSSQIRTGDFTAIFSGGLAGINANDIESVTVLKDASAAAIYGSRAAGGVIVVTTKRGKAGRLQTSYSNYFSVNTKPQRMMNMMNSSEKLAWEQTLWDNFSIDGFQNNTQYPTIGLVGIVRAGKGEYAGLTAAQQDQVIADAASHTTNWFEELFQHSLSQNHYVSLSGGNERNRYFVSAGYGNNNGLVQKTAHDRYNLSAKIDITPNDRLEIALNTDLSAQTSTSPSVNQDLFRYAYFANPYERPYNADGSYRGDRTFYSLKEYNGGGYDIYSPPNGYNILREINETSNINDNYSGTLTAQLGYKISNLLRFSGIGSYSYTNNQSDNINGRYTGAAFRDRLYFDAYPSERTYGSITQTSSANSSYMLRGQLELRNFLRGPHHISTLVGSEIRAQRAKSVFSKRYGYDEITGNASMPVPPKPIGNDMVDYNGYISYATMVDGLSGQVRSEDAFASFYFSTDYNYDRRYTLSLTARTDGSNNFGADQQFNPAWSAGLSWNVDQEDFFTPVKHIVSRFSLKAATGYTGNVNRQVFPQLIMDYLTTFRKTYDDYYRMGRIGNAPNRNLRWEKTQDYKVAADFGLFKDRITALVEYYTRYSTDLVTVLRIPSSTGFTSQRFNTSSVQNSGFEVTLSGTILRKDEFSWGISANMAHNYNKLTKFSTATGTANTTAGQQVGYPLNSIFAGKVLGIDPTTGIYTYALRPDALILSNADLRDAGNYAFYLGTSDAPVSGGFSTNVRYKAWTLSIGGNFSLNGKIIDEVNPVTNYSSIQQGGSSASRETIPTSYNDLYLHHLNIPRERANVWTVDNPVTNAYPRLIDHYAAPIGLDLTNPTLSSITRASMLKDISYLRVGSLHLGYNLKEEWTKSWGIKNAGVNFSMSNLFTFTNYDGIDPETPGAVYPLTRSFSFGIHIGF